MYCLLGDPDLWTRMFLKCSITTGFTCPLLSWCQISSLLRENNNVIVFAFPFPHLHVTGPIAVHLPSRKISHPKDKKLLWPLPPHPPFDKAVVTWLEWRERIIPTFIRPPTMLTVYSVAVTRIRNINLFFPCHTAFGGDWLLSKETLFIWFNQLQFKIS